MRKWTNLRTIWLAVFVAAWVASPSFAASRIKDIVQFEGVRENMLIGYGLVVGLRGTGDALRNAPFTRQSLEAMLERLGVNTRDANLNTKNVAAVMVTARLPPFAAAGSTMDLSVSAMGDAKSLLGGTLLVTPLLGADGQAYAVGQGTVQDRVRFRARRVWIERYQGRAHRRAYRRRRDCRTRDRLQAGRRVTDAHDPSQPRLHHGAAGRRCHQRAIPRRRNG